MSSPSRQVIDPLICSFSDNPDRRSKMAPTSSGSNGHSGKFFSTQQAPSSTWTPLVSRTFTGEIGSLNSTPGQKVFTSMQKHNGPAGGPQFSADADFGLNLTPFLTHSMNLLAHPNSAGNSSANGNFTPYYDKTMHMADFFMDSPIRQSPGKIEGLTPARFELREDTESRLNAALSMKKPASSHQPKRSITQLDTPARHPAKKSGTSATTVAKDDVQYDSDAENSIPKKFDDAHFATPSKKKGLREALALALNKTPLPLSAPLHDKNFLTPAAKCPILSPSTVIMSSAIKSPVDMETTKRIPPPSPTPLKDSKAGAEPVMGIFSERKPVLPKVAESVSEIGTSRRLNKKQLGGAGKFQIVFTDVHTLMNSKKKKHGDATETGKADKKAERKKGKGKGKIPVQAQVQAQPQVSLQTRTFNGSQYADNSQGLHPNFAGLGASPAYGNAAATSLFNSGMHPMSSFSMSQDFNTSMSSAKEFSMVNNSTVNTTHGNMTSTDHASFEMMHGGLISTPNGKFLLDNLFEKHSPTVMHHMSASRFADKHDNIHPLFHEEMHMPREYMPPPPKNFSLQQAAQAALRQDKPYPEHLQQQEQPQFYHQHFPQFQQFSQQQQRQQQHQPNMAMNMLMSTPQHESIMHGGSPYEQDEPSPSDKDSMRYLYQQLHQFQPVKSPHGPQPLGVSVTNADEEPPAKTPTSTTKKAPKRKTKKR